MFATDGRRLGISVNDDTKTSWHDGEELRSIARLIGRCNGGFAIYFTLLSLGRINMITTIYDFIYEITGLGSRYFS